MQYTAWCVMLKKNLFPNVFNSFAFSIASKKGSVRPLQIHNDPE